MAHELLLTTIHSVDGIVLLIFAIVLLKRTLPNTLLQQHLEQYRYLPSPLKSRAIIILSLNTPPTSLLGIISIVKKRIYIYTNSCRPLCEILTAEMISCRTFAGGRLYSRSSKGFETRELWTSEISKFSASIDDLLHQATFRNISRLWLENQGWWTLQNDTSGHNEL